MTDEDPTAAALARLEAQIATLSAVRDKLARAAELEAEARPKNEEARRLRAEAAVVLGDSPLPSVNIPSKVTNNMVTTHRLAISKGHTGKDPFASAIRAAGFTVRSLAKRLDIPHSLISMYRAKDGRPCPRARAERIQKLTGWPADDAHWPNKLVS